MLLAAFVIRERRAPAPLLDLALLHDRGITGANLTFALVGLLATLVLPPGPPRPPAPQPHHAFHQHAGGIP